MTTSSANVLTSLAARAEAGSEDQLTELELQCCYMSQFGLDGASLKDWRAEFAECHRDDKCRDCPLAAQQDRPTEGGNNG